MDNEHFPHYGLGGTVPELYLMDLYPLNFHINHDKWDVIRNYVDLRSAVRLEDDFLGSPTAAWTVSKTGSGTNVITDIANGVLLITNAAADNDKIQYLSNGQSFILKPGFPVYVEGRFKINDVVESDFFFGLVDAEYLGASTANGVYFHKDDGSASILCAVEDATVVGTDAITGISAVNATWLVLAFHYDGAGTVRWFIFTDAGIVRATGEITAGFPLNVELYLGFGLMNGTGVAKNLSVDYVKAVAKRIV